jgi:hypothetical protein
MLFQMLYYFNLLIMKTKYFLSLVIAPVFSLLRLSNYLFPGLPEKVRFGRFAGRDIIPVTLPVLQRKKRLSRGKVYMHSVVTGMFCFGILLLPFSLLAQNVGINGSGNSPDSCAMLDISSQSSGLLIPRMSKIQKLSINKPANGLLVYQTDDTTGIWYYDVSVWKPLYFTDLQINTGTGLTGGPLNGQGTISISNTGVIPGMYGNSRELPLIRVNAQGQITDINSVSINELDSVVGNEISDTISGGFLDKSGLGTVADPYRLGLRNGNGAGQFLFWNGSSWQTLKLQDGGGIAISGNIISNTGDRDSSNDIIIGSSAGGDLGGSYPHPSVTGLQGRSISSALPTNKQVLSWNGTQWIPADPVAEKDSVLGNEISDTIAGGFLNRSGNGTSANPYRVGLKPGSITGQVLTWDGSKWITQKPSGFSEKDSVLGNEISDTISGGFLNRSGSGTAVDPYKVGLKPGNVTGQVLTWDGAKWVSQTQAAFPLEKDSVTGNEISDTLNARGILIRTGNGTAADPYKIGAAAGTAQGQVFTWDGNKWTGQSPAAFPLEKDSVSGNEISDTINARGLLVRSGMGTSADPYKIGVSAGISVGHFLTWDGNKWVSQAAGTFLEKDSVLGNEISDTIAGGFLNRTGNGTTANPYKVGLKAGNTIGEVLTWNGSKWITQAPAVFTEKDSVTGNEITDTTNARGFLIKSGMGTTGNPYKIGVNPGNTSGDVLTWDGNKWIGQAAGTFLEKDSVLGNEISDTIAGGFLNRTGNGTAGNPYKVGLKAGTTVGEIITWDGSKWINKIPATFIEKDSVTGNEISDTSNARGFLIRSGMGTSTDPYKIGVNSGNSSGDVLTWNGSRWISQAAGTFLEKDSVLGNEISDTIAGGFLNRTGNGTAGNPYKVGLKAGTTVGEIITWDGSKWISKIPTSFIEKDSVTGNEISDTSNARGFLIRSGTGTTADPYKIGVNSGSSSGDVLTWDGSRWISQAAGTFLEKDSVLGNEITDTTNARGFLVKSGMGTTGNPYKIGVNSGNSSGDVLTWDGNKWISQAAGTFLEKDSVLGNEITDTTNARGFLVKSGMGTTGNPHKIGVNSGNSSGDVLTWDGNKWISQAAGTFLEKDSVLGNEITDTTNARGFLVKSGMGTTGNPYKIGVSPGNTSGDVLTWDGNKWISQAAGTFLEKDSVLGNEISDTISGGFLNRTGNGTAGNPYKVGLKSGSTMGEVLTWDGSKWTSQAIPALPLEKDSVLGNEISDTISGGFLNRIGNGTAGNPYKVGLKSGSAMGEVLTWDGSKWTGKSIATPPLEKDSVLGNEISDTLNAYGILVRSGAGTAGSPFKLGVNPGSLAGDVLTWNGSRWVSGTLAAHSPEQDSVIGNEIADTVNSYGLLVKSGAGTAASPRKIGVTPGTVANQYLKWNGSAWIPAAVIESDSIIGNEFSDTIALGFIRFTGTGTTASPKKIGLKPGSNAGEVLTWDGTKWAADSTVATAWSLYGNAGTVDATHFIGTTDNKPFNIRANNLNAGKIDPVKNNTFYGVQSGNSATAGSNSAFGYRALYANTSGTYNTAIGVNALASVTTGSNSVAVGDSALYSFTGLNQNVAIGSAALKSSTSGGFNTAIGGQALYANTTGVSNFAGGYNALRFNINGQHNSAGGYRALYMNTSGSYNTGTGSMALYGNSSGTYNTGNGYQALYLNNTGAYNTASGSGALYNNDAGDNNTADGSAALSSNTSGDANTASGKSVLYLNTTGSYNTAQGYLALYSNTTGYSNVAVGTNTLYKNTTASNIVAVGDSALLNNGNGASMAYQSIENTAVGSKGLYSNTTGYWNSGVGTKALYSNTTGHANTAVGCSAMYANTTGPYNVAVGMSALAANTSGAYNVANGYLALRYNVTGAHNIGVGYATLYSNNAGHFNIALGTEALYDNNGGDHNIAQGYYSLRNSNSDRNIAIGDHSMYSNTNGASNTAVGHLVMYTNTTGFSNVAMGVSALYKNTNRGNIVAIGDSALYNNGTGASTTLHSNANTALGSKVLYLNTTGYNNTAAGYEAHYKNTTGYSNASYGSNSLYSNTTGFGLVALGDSALYSNTTSNYSVAVGAAALKSSTSGGFNVATGYHALYKTTTGYSNTASGYNALTLNVDGNHNTATGYQALQNNTAGSNNTATGSFSMVSNITGVQNSAYGANSLGGNTTGEMNVAIGTYALGGNTTADGNSAVGYAALYKTTTGNYNTAQGFLALNSNTTTSWSVALGDSALYTSTSALPNVAVGSKSLKSNTSGTYNAAVGYQSLYKNTTGDYNTALGSASLWTNTSGDRNIAIGYQSLYSNTSGFGNTASGYQALMYNTNAGGNTANGYMALYLNTGQANTAVGYQSLYSNTSGIANTAIGHSSIFSNSTGQYLSALGYYALNANTSGNSNTAMGYYALSSNTGGSDNSAVGNYASSNNKTASGNSAFGNDALRQNTYGSKNVAIGGEALYSQSYANGNSSWNTENVAVGFQSLYSNQPTSSSNGLYNTALGAYALYDNTTGYENTASGWRAMESNTSGFHNSAFGKYSLRSNTTGDDNTATGVHALYSNTTGDENTASGFRALYSNTSGDQNVAIGLSALYSGASANRCVAVGPYAMNSNSTGDYNTAVGNNAFYNGTNYSNSTAIGSSSNITASNQVRIGDGSVSSIGGQVGWTTVSDQRFKKEIKETVPGLAFISRLRPVTYYLDMNAIARHMNTPDSLRRFDSEKMKGAMLQTGFIAQEVEQAASQLGFDFSGVDKPKNSQDHYGLRYAEFVVPLVKAVQEQQEMIKAMQLQLEQQQKLIQMLQSK